jgi:hypothetical protein
MAVVATLGACAGPAEGPPAGVDAGPAGEAVTRSTQVGPVRVDVEVTPAKPRLGDPVTLKLTVVADPGVNVEMPAFGEALGRFSILDFTPRQSTAPGGATTLVQEYRLQPPMSGKQRVPALRVEFSDGRDGGTPEPKEILTESITLEVASALEAGAAGLELRPARGTLSESLGPGPFRRYGPWAAGLLGLLLLAAGGPLLRRHLARRVKVTAYDVASRRLAALEDRGLPGPDEADGWYVELSAIVRRYLEDRYGVRAPELTTEEFLRETRGSDLLEPVHRDLLTSFLEGCDRVKFGGHRPDAAESQEALHSARRFLDETRLRDHEPTDQPAPAAAA